MVIAVMVTVVVHVIVVKAVVIHVVVAKAVMVRRCQLRSHPAIERPGTGT
jgi:hypothetical protein